MNAFLVILRCASDDIPLALFATQQAADEYAEEFDPDVPLAMERHWNLDATVRFSVDIVRFRGGSPDGSYQAKDIV